MILLFIQGLVVPADLATLICSCPHLLCLFATGNVVYDHKGSEQALVPAHQ